MIIAPTNQEYYLLHILVHEIGELHCTFDVKHYTSKPHLNSLLDDCIWRKHQNNIKLNEPS